MLLSQRAYAKRIGVSPAAINKQIKAGIIPLHGGKIDPEEADRCRASRCDPMKLKNAPAMQADQAPPVDGETLAEAKRRGEVLKNRQRQLIVGELEGRLIDKGKATRAVFSLARNFREHWMNWPARVAPVLAAELGVDPKRLQGELDRLVRENLAEMADAKLNVK